MNTYLSSRLSMPMNPLNVLKLLFQEISIPAMNLFNDVEILEENTVNFTKPCKFVHFGVTGIMILRKVDGLSGFFCINTKVREICKMDNI